MRTFAIMVNMTPIVIRMLVSMGIVSIRLPPVAAQKEKAFIEKYVYFRRACDYVTLNRCNLREETL